jgi:long-chain fatty acid transport protein
MNKTKLALAVALSGIITTNALATNGYFAHGYGAKEKGMAGAGVAKGSSSISAANNPANLLQVGERMDVGVSFFNPVRSYEVTGGPAIPAGFGPVLDMGDGNGGLPGCAFGNTQPTCQVPFSTGPQKVESGSEWFAIPSFGFSSKIDDLMAWGIAVYGNGGMNSDYEGGTATFLNPQTNTMVEAPGTFGAGKTGVDLSQLFINTSFAYQTSDTVALGASVIFAAQAFEANGLAPFANNSVNPEKLTNNGHDISTGFGFRLGANFNLSDSVTLGASYQTKMRMSEFDDYAGLFAENGDFDIPSTYTIGIAWATSDSSTLLLDYQAIQYSDVTALGNGIAGLLNPATCTDALNNTLINMAPSPASGVGCLGGSGAGFGWDDVSVIKLGYEWSIGEDTFRVGYSTNNQPIDPEEVNFNLLAPGVVEDHFTVGYTSNSGENEWTVFLMYAPEVEVSGQSQFDPSQTISFKMYQLELGIDYQL